ncbi:MAG: CheY-like chemotaxis protein, partial [Candidatus Krumholzibacteriia bacterium]
MVQKLKKKRPQSNLSAKEPSELDKIVHDLNNVLFALGGFVDIAVDDSPDGHPAHEALVEAVRASDSAIALVARLLPLQGAEEVRTKKTPVSRAVAKPRAVSARCVLVIEEEATVAALMERALKRFGFEPRVFIDAHEALQMFVAAPDEFDAIVTDESSPDAVGLDVVVKMQAIRPLLPIILMTSGREYMLMSRALEAGIQHVMHKPVKIQELCRTLEELTLT